MTWLKIHSFAAALALLAAGPLSAGTIDAFYGALGGTNFEQVSFTYAGNPYAVNTALDLGTRIDSPGPGVDTLVPHNFDAFCVEIDQNLYINSNNHHANVVPMLGASTTPDGAPGSGPVLFDATRTLMMERLWGGFESTVSTQHTAAAFQLAVWEIAFDNDQTLLGSSLLHASAGDLANPGSAASIAEGWLAQVRNLNVSLFAQPLLVMNDPSTQDLITPAPPINTPEPTSLVLLAIGVIGLAVMARRKR